MPHFEMGDVNKVSCKQQVHCDSMPPMDQTIWEAREGRRPASQETCRSVMAIAGGAHRRNILAVALVSWAGCSAVFPEDLVPLFGRGHGG
jgi:hypothetical protein